jgi:hypothetical protein
MTHEVAGHVRIELERRVGVEGRCKGVSSDVKMLERPCNAWNLIDVWYFCGLALQLPSWHMDRGTRELDHVSRIAWPRTILFVTDITWCTLRGDLLCHCAWRLCACMKVEERKSTCCNVKAHARQMN